MGCNLQDIKNIQSTQPINFLSTSFIYANLFPGLLFLSEILAQLSTVAVG